MDSPAWGSEGFEQITAELAERILTITLNRPERLNAWTPTMARELIEAFDRADADDEVGAGIIMGAGLRPAGGRLGTARELAGEMVVNAAPVSVGRARRMLWRMLGAVHAMIAHRADSRAMFSRGESADAVEGVTSFLEKRPARFGDRVSDGLPDVQPDWVEPEFR